MISYTRIHAVSHSRRMDELVHDYFEKTKAKENLPDLDIDWNVYLDLEKMGRLLVIGAFDEGRLVGFVMYVIASNLHHKRITCASCDLLSVRPEYRNQHIGRHMMAAAESIMRHMDVHYITHQFRTDYEVEPLFGKLGYELIERTYRKRIA